MILKGSQRGGGKQMAIHLLNAERNEHVNVHEVRGFIAPDVMGALNEAYAVSKGTQCRQFMYSLSLNPPQDKKVSISDFISAIDKSEKKLGLEDQPRVVVFHEKEGRRHAHCVWSRIDIDKMKAVNMSHDHRKLNSLSKSLYLEHGWDMPKGFRDKNQKNPLNYTRGEWQQAARIGRRPSDIKKEMQECWGISDNKLSFEAAMKERGYYIAKGDKRGHVAVDLFGEVYSLSRQLNVKKDDLSNRLGTPETLLSVSQVKTEISGRLSHLFKNYSNELNLQHKKQFEPLLAHKQKQQTSHRNEREKQDALQKSRWQLEETKRSERVRKGFKGLWDKVSGRYWKTRKRNEIETTKHYQRDTKEKENLIQNQLSQRAEIQEKIIELRETQLVERQALVKEISHFEELEQPQALDKKERLQERNKGKGFDWEPEI